MFKYKHGHTYERKGSMSDESRFGDGRYALVIPPDVALDEQPDNQEQLFAYQLSLARGKYANPAMSMWRDTHSRRPTKYYLYAYGDKPTDARGVQKEPIKEFTSHELYETAKSYGFFTEDKDGHNRREKHWFNLGIPEPAGK
ncbi:hypothetical protein ACEPAH_8661 [Sanghuangporus vaninii]